MRVYLVECISRRYIVRARSKSQAAVRVENTIPDSFISTDSVKRLPENNTVYRVKK